MRALFHTLGCKVNQYETQAMRRLMEQAGFETGEYQPGQPDAGDAVIVVNSCTVTGESDRKLRQLLRRARRDNPRAVLVLTGCMPQAFPAVAEGYEEADIVLGNAQRRSLPRQVEAFLTCHQRIVDVSAHGAAFEPLSIEDFEGRTRAFVKIEDGCNRFCSYCIIPYARGRVRSRALSELEQELRALGAHGYREVVLVGINLTAFGRDTGHTLADAVDVACRVPEIARVRLGSLEPDDMTPDLLTRLRAQPKLCPQFHLSLQSGCDATLARMRRRYTAAEYARTCAALREAFPGCALTTDVMVGFPGEDEAEFEASLRFVESIGFAKVHVFAYSRRPGTPAADAPRQVPQAEKVARSHRMITLCDASRERYLRQQIGRTVPVLTETRLLGGGTGGYTDTYVPVRLSGVYPPGELIKAVVTDVSDGACLAEAASVQPV